MTPDSSISPSGATPDAPATPQPGSAVRIRLLEELDEYRACVRLQEDVWGQGFSERAPLSLLKVVQRVGGVVAGAFAADGTLEGFVFGITGLVDGEPFHWSDMLAVRPGRRNRGIGLRLKRFQREVCLERDVRRMAWTFEPLESRNAWINLGRLGAVARAYEVDMYGDTDSPLHREVGTDRLVALWDLDSVRVRARLEGRHAPPCFADVVHLPRALEVEYAGGLPRPRVPSRRRDGAAAPPGGFLVPIPTDLEAVIDRDPALARRWREAVRGVLPGSLAPDREVRELVRGEEGVSWYVVGPMDAPEGSATPPAGASP